MIFQEPSRKRKKPNPSGDEHEQQGHVATGADNDGASVQKEDAEDSNKDNGYTDDLMLLHKEIEKENPCKKVVKSLMSKTFEGRRAWIVNECSLVSDILNMFPPLSTPKYVSMQSLREKLFTVSLWYL